MTTKWTTLYKYIPLEYVQKTIEKQRLYLSDGSNFNDPFEVTITDKNNGQINHVKGLHILSLTNSYRNKLIWSHYSESHKSVCLTVKVPTDLVYPICYSTKRVYVDSDLDQILEKGTYHRKKNVKKSFSALSNEKKIALIKDRKWNYEHEYRIVFDKSDEPALIHEDNKWFMSVKIVNVYLGVNFDENENTIKQKIIDTCIKNGIRTTKMRLSLADYSIRAEKTYLLTK